MYGYIVQEVLTKLMLNHGINKQLYNNQDLSFQNKVTRAEVMVSNNCFPFLGSNYCISPYLVSFKVGRYVMAKWQMLPGIPPSS